MNETVSLIKDIGFPAFVCIYLLIQQSKETKSLTTAVNSLTLMIQHFVDTIGKDGKV